MLNFQFETALTFCSRPIIENIKVEGGKAEVGFYADGAAASWCRIDDVWFQRTGDIPDGIEAIRDTHATHGKGTYYSPDGRKLGSMQRGINIVRETTGSKKVLHTNNM